MNERPTPETDGLTFFAQPGMIPPYNTVPSEFARKLERERDEAIALLESEKSTSLFAGPMRSAMVFAARYTHTRNTGGTLAVVRALEQCWHVLDDKTRDQILRESHEAEYNLDDWQRLRDFAANVKDHSPIGAVGGLTQDEINVGLFDEVKKLQDIKRRHEADEFRMAQEIDHLRGVMARLCRAVSRRMMPDDPTPEDRMELREAFDAASSILHNDPRQETAPERTDGGCTPIVPDDSPCLPNSHSTTSVAE